MLLHKHKNIASMIVQISIQDGTRRASQLYKQKSDFYELWLQYKLLKSIETSGVWPHTYNERYIQPFQPELTHKIH